MISFLQEWYNRHFSDPQVVLLALILIIGFAVVILAGGVLAPLLAAIVFAYVLDGGVERLMAKKCPRLIAVPLVFVVSMSALFLFFIWMVPLLIQQTGQFFSEVPLMVNKGQQALMGLPERYPEVVNEQDIESVITQIRQELGKMGQTVLSVSLSSVVNLITVLVYVVLVPVLVFFLLKDKHKIFKWASGFLPEDRSLATEVWREMNAKIASYTRGKLTEISIVWFVTYITFAALGLNYAMLLSFLVGLSVIIPYVGAAIATVPIAMIGYFQWGLTYEFTYVMVAYMIIQFLDGNILVPLLFSEAVNLHPIAIIAAVLLFGGIWGVWGVFFAIPLATLVQAVLNAWPKRDTLNALKDNAASEQV